MKCFSGLITFDFQVDLAGEIVAFPDDAHVAASVGHLRLLDDQGEDIFVRLKAVFGPLVAFLKSSKYQNVKNVSKNSLVL